MDSLGNIVNTIGWVALGILIFGALTLLFDLNFVRGRLFSAMHARTRVRYGIVASVLVILLAALDIYLTLAA